MFIYSFIYLIHFFFKKDFKRGLCGDQGGGGELEVERQRGGEVAAAVGVGSPKFTCAE